MRVYIGDKYKMKKYRLPETIEDSFLINYKSLIDNEEKNITIQAENGAWHIHTTKTVLIYQRNTVIDDVTLIPHESICVCFTDTEEFIFLFVEDRATDNYTDYQLSGLNTITIGNGTNNTISYSNYYFTPNHIQLKIDSDNKWILTANPDASAIYVNHKATLNQKLLYGDEIFAFGLKVIIMPTFIRVSNIAEKTQINGLIPYTREKEDNTKVEEISNKDKYTGLYKESDYFFHRPNIKPAIEPVEVSIDIPPQKEKGDQTPMILSMGASVVMCISSMSTGLVSIYNILTKKSTFTEEISNVIMCIGMLIATLLIPVLTHYYEKSRIFLKERKRLKKYGKYIKDKEKIITDTLAKQSQVLNELYVSQEECLHIIETNDQNFWSREINDADFLKIRIGRGDVSPSLNIKFQSEDFVLEDDKMQLKAQSLADSEKVLKDVPIAISLVKTNILAFIANNTIMPSFIDNIMLQLLTFHSSFELKIVLFVNDKNSPVWDKYKYLSHLISQDGEKRFYATTDEDMKEISSYLDKIYVDRMNEFKNQENEAAENIEDKTENYRAFNSYYLIITDDVSHTRDMSIIDRLLKTNYNYGFSLLMFENALKNLPSRCKEFINITDKEGVRFTETITQEKQLKFVPEFLNNKIDLSSYLFKLSNIPVASRDAAASLPPSLEFLEMYKVGKIEQLNISNRWQNNDPTVSLSAPVGVHPSGNLLELNLHEKMHGPHGLIAGSTGSGKSEFIITYILSMCINYSPNEVQFVLIDYKGGGLAGAFENREKKLKIPHLVGTITNLDTSEMNRSLVSIRSELKRRQRIFNETRDALGESTIDIYKYQKYYREFAVQDPIAHLFIVSDEFAELKSQQPDFMDELVSTARIGRSLGVHLILATQKPSGVVDDQIWSNTRFKVCLKVQSEADSVEMLKRADAASIKEAGRFYLQVGTDEIFEIGQSAWSGARYIPTDTIVRKVDDSIDFITDSGNIIKKINEAVKVEEQVDMGDQLTNIVKYLIDLANKEKIVTEQLWLPSIPDTIYIGNIIKKYEYKPTPWDFKIPIGEYDDPERQYQGILIHDLENDGNTIIYGVQGSGKENLISTLIYVTCSFHSPTEINFYILDFGSEILKVFGKMPHVGEYITAYENDKIQSLFQMLDKEFNRRKEKLSEFGGNFSQYNEKEEVKLPLITIILNNFEGFIENAEEMSDSLSKLLREGTKFGIIFIMTSNATNGVPGRMSQNCQKLYGMRFQDEFDYRFVLNAEPGLIPKKIFGRGLTAVNERILEFQTANINILDNINDTIKVSAQNLAATYKTKAKSIPVIPSKVDVDNMIPNITDSTSVPIGVNMNDSTIGTYDFNHNRIICITGNNIQMGTSFVEELLKLFTHIPDLNLVMLDLFRTTDIPTGIMATTNLVEFMDAAAEAIPRAEQPEGHRLVIVTGVSEVFNDDSYETQKNIFVNLLNNCEQYSNTSFVLIDNYMNFKEIISEEWYQNKYNKKNGIWIGGGIDTQLAFEIESIASEDKEQYTDDVGYLIKDGKYELVRIIESDDAV